MSNLFDSIFPNIEGSQNVANKLLSMFGDKGIITKKEQVYNPKDGSYDSDDIDYEIIVTPPLQFNVRDYDSENILRGDLYCFINADTLHKEISTLDYKELKGCTITINDTCFTIVGVTPIFSGKNISSYKLQLRNPIRS